MVKGMNYRGTPDSWPWHRTSLFKLGVRSLFFPAVRARYLNGRTMKVEVEFDGRLFRNSWRCIVIGLEFILFSDCYIWFDTDTGYLYMEDPTA